MQPDPRPAAPVRQTACGRCGAVFGCGLGADCWCAAEPYRLPVPGAAAADCLCPDCLRTLAAAPR